MSDERVEGISKQFQSRSIKIDLYWTLKLMPTFTNKFKIMRNETQNPVLRMYQIRVSGWVGIFLPSAERERNVL